MTETKECVFNRRGVRTLIFLKMDLGFSKRPEPQLSVGSASKHSRELRVSSGLLWKNKLTVKNPATAQVMLYCVVLLGLATGI